MAEYTNITMVLKFRWMFHGSKSIRLGRLEAFIVTLTHHTFTLGILSGQTSFLNYHDYVKVACNSSRIRNASNNGIPSGSELSDTNPGI